MPSDQNDTPVSAVMPAAPASPAETPAPDKLTPFLGPLAKLAGSQKFTVLVLSIIAMALLGKFGVLAPALAAELSAGLIAAWKLAHGIQERKPQEPS